MIAEKLVIGNVPSVVYRPNNYESGKKYPVFLFTHGKGEWLETPEKDPGSSLLKNGNHANLLLAGDERGFIIVAPQLVLSLNSWVPGWTNKYLSPVYDHILNKLPTNTDHIKSTGLSLGGGGVYVVCTGEFAPYVSAAVPICGTPQYDQDFSMFAKYSIPAWAFHAKNDTTVDCIHSINQINRINSFNPNPKAKLTLLDSGGHYIWGDVLSRKEMYDWAFSYKNNFELQTIPDPPPPLPNPFNKIIHFEDGSAKKCWIESI